MMGMGYYFRGGKLFFTEVGGFLVIDGILIGL